MRFIEDPRYFDLYKRFAAFFHEGLPTYMLPGDEEYEDLERNCERCFAAGKNLLPEIYDYGNHPERIY